VTSTNSAIQLVYACAHAICFGFFFLRHARRLSNWPADPSQLRSISHWLIAPETLGPAAICDEG
jgi:hypothetical protein